MRNIIIQPAASVAVALTFGLSLNGAAYAANPGDTAAWDGIRGDIFGTRDIHDGAGKVALEAPYRAEDASTVPISYPAAR